MMRFPSSTRYQEIIQNPNVCFQDPLLSNCKVETNPMGMPFVGSGGFALTFKLIGNGKQWAVRCFKSLIEDRNERYQVISQFLQNQHTDILIPVYYSDTGIKVDNNWYPITYMPWVMGASINKFLDKNYKNRQALLGLVDEIQRLVAELERLQIAHGDLSNSNILIQNHKMILVDYDGMFVPQLAGKPSREKGNACFQHPARSEHFDAQIDRFSSIVIYMALQAIACRPSIWETYQGGEGLLFKRNDFERPDQSPLLRELETIPELTSLVPTFRAICKIDVTQVPRLADFINGASVPVPTQKQEIVFSQGLLNQSIRNLDAQITPALWENLGERVAVIGRITEVSHGVTRYGDPYVFLNVGHFPHMTFTIVLWPEALKFFQEVGKDPDQYNRQWVSVIGLLREYKGRLQIHVDSPSEIEVLKNETEAKRRLAERSEPAYIIPPQSKSTKAVKKMHRVSAEKQTSSPPPVPSSPTMLSPDQFRKQTEEKITNLYSGLQQEQKTSAKVVHTSTASGLSTPAPARTSASGASNTSVTKGIQSGQVATSPQENLPPFLQNQIAAPHSTPKILKTSTQSNNISGTTNNEVHSNHQGAASITSHTATTANSLTLDPLPTSSERMKQDRHRKRMRKRLWFFTVVLLFVAVSLWMIVLRLYLPYFSSLTP